MPPARRHGSAAPPVAALLLALALAAPRQATAQEVLLGMSAAFSGPSQALGSELYRGALAYFSHLNASGGIEGRPVAIRAYDDGYEPEPAVLNTVRLVERDDVLALFGYVGTPTVTRVMPLIAHYRDRPTLFFFPFTGAQPQRQPRFDGLAFNLRASYRQETAGLVESLVGIGRRRIAVFFQADAYGRSGWDGVRKALASHGLTIVAEATYRRGSSFGQSYREQVRLLRRGDPQAVISIASYAAAAGFVRDARDSGLEVPICNVSFVGSESLLDLLEGEGRRTGRDYTRWLVTSQVVPSYEDTSLPAVRQYRELMARLPAGPSPPLAADYQPVPLSFVSFEGFLDAKVMAELLRRAAASGTLDRAALQRAATELRDLDIGIDVPVHLGPAARGGIGRIYPTWVVAGHFHRLPSWEALKDG